MFSEIKHLSPSYQAAWEILQNPSGYLSLLGRVMEAALHLAEAEQGFIWLADDNHLDITYPQVIRRLPTMYPQREFDEKFRPAYELCGQVGQSGKSIVVAHTETNSMAVPFIHAETIIGVLYLQRNAETGKFTPEQCETVTVFSAALVNALVVARINLATPRENMVVLAHETRNPMQSAKGYINLLLDGKAGLLTDNQSKFLQAALKNNERLEQIFRRLTLLSFIETGIEFYGGECSSLSPVIDLLQKMAKEYQAKIDINQQNIFLELPDFSLTSKIPQVYVNQWIIDNIFEILLENASLYMPHSGEIRVRVVVEEKFVRFEFVDSGMGIKDDELPHIFHQYYRSNRAKEMSWGFGLGLYLSNCFIEMCGGKMGAKGVENQGSTFWLTLPINTNI